MTTEHPYRPLAVEAPPAPTVWDLLEVINTEAVARADRGQPLPVVRLHPVTFKRVVDEFNARVFGPEEHVVLRTAVGALRVVPGPDADVEDHPYFDSPSDRHGAQRDAATDGTAPGVASPGRHETPDGGRSS